MPAKDKYHDIVRVALEKSGWSITHDPYIIRVGKRRGFIDLGAEFLAAEKDAVKIAVEIKSFTGVSDLDQFEDALGQFLIYLVALEIRESDRSLYLAVPEPFYESFFDDPFFLDVAKRFNVSMVVFNYKTQTIVKWTK
jgi:hypothetical protein